MIRLVSLLWRIFGQSGDPFGVMFRIADYIASNLSKEEEKNYRLHFSKRLDLSAA